MSDIPEVAKLLQQLVRIPSVNPAGDPGTPHIGEERLALFLKDHLTALGAEVEMQEVAVGRPNVIGRFRCRQTASRAVIMESHTDTVSVLGMTVDPFGGEIRDGRVWGRGSCDTKGPMAAILAALESIGREEWPETTDIYFVGAMGEEAGNEGAIHLMTSGFFKDRGVPVDFAVALEPTEMKVVYKHKGAMWLKIISEGKAAHASMPHLGENAISKMRKALDFIAERLPIEYSRFEDPELGNPTFSVNMIHGGSKVNIIPDHCEIELDHRALPKESLEGLLEIFARHLPEFRVEVTSCRPGLATARDHPQVERLVRAIRRHGASGDALTTAPWFADSGVFGEAGIASVAFGPGSIEQAHTRDEHITIDQLVLGEKVFGAFLKDLE